MMHAAQWAVLFALVTRREKGVWVVSALSATTKRVSCTCKSIVTELRPLPNPPGNVQWGCG